MPESDGPRHDLRRLIEVLDRHGVEYLLVGGAAATAHGAERPTDDADCVVSRGRENLDRLAAALRELKARRGLYGTLGPLSRVDAQRTPICADMRG
jgi:hypothetical protein